MKAVILAGGMGTRLRPLTESIPKPLAVIYDRPIICHILDLLIANGFDEIYVTLKYKGEMIENALRQYHEKVKINYVYETEFLGTAGSVKNAVGKTDEDLLVISGDAYCEFELKKAVEFHIKSQSTATIITRAIGDPREYGLAVFDESKRITRFIEKPSWSQAVTNQANCGVYVLKGECLDIIPEKAEFDFSLNLFPLMLKNGYPLYAYEETGFWCDIGQIESYVDCNARLCEMSGRSKDVPRGDFTIEKGVYIGKNVKIYDGALIGKGSHIGDNVTICKNAKILSSVIYPDCTVGQDSLVEKSVLCYGASTGKGVRINEYCCIGENAVLEENATVGRLVNVAPNISIGPSVFLDRSAEKSIQQNLSSYVSDGFIPNIDCFDALELGCAVGKAFNGRKTAVASDGNPLSNAVLNAFCSGVASGGAYVWSFGKSFLVQTYFFTSFCSLEAGAFFSTSGGNTSVRLFAEGGLPLIRKNEREIISSLNRRERFKPDENKIRLPVDMSSMNSIYSRVLFRQSDGSLSKMKVNIDCKNEQIRILLDECIRRLEGETGEGITLHISEDGLNFSVTENNIDYIQPQLMSLLIFHETKLGRDVALPHFSPKMYSSVASVNNREVMRFLFSSSDKSDAPARAAAKNQPWTTDALFASVRILSLMHEEGKTLSQLMNEVPDFSVSTARKRIAFLPSELYSAFSNELVSFENEGLSLSKNGACALVVPDGSGKSVKILSESFNAEAAEELCADISKKLDDFSHSETQSDT